MASTVTLAKTRALCLWLTMMSRADRLCESKATAVRASVASTVGPRSWRSR